MINYNMIETIAFLGQHKTVQLSGFLTGFIWTCLTKGEDKKINVCTRPITCMVAGAINGGVTMMAISVVQFILPKDIHPVIPICLGISVLSGLKNAIVEKSDVEKND